MFWQAFASSTEGSQLLAVSGITVVSEYGAGYIYISTNSGTTWAMVDAPFKMWKGVASSADGSKLAGSAQANFLRGFSGGIYTALSASAPRLNLAPTDGKFTLSWLVPSTNFVMQQSSDLGSWTSLTNQPVLNLTNLQNELILPPAGSSGFYRLKTP
jgi:hypothetical protein